MRAREAIETDKVTAVPSDARNNGSASAAKRCSRSIGRIDKASRRRMRKTAAGIVRRQHRK